MKITSLLTFLVSGLLAAGVFAQTPAIPPAPATPPVAHDAPATPATPAAAPTAPTPPAVSGVPGAGKGVAEVGKLFRTDRQKNDKGQFTWVCTYNVAGTKRAVAYDESCPSEMTFELKR